MARRRGKKELDSTSVSLFPFLSVLACVIGSLTLLLAAMAIGEMGGQALDHARLVERQQDVDTKIASARAALSELEDRIHNADELSEEDERLRARLSGLGLSADLSLEELTALTNVMREAKEFAQRKAELESEQTRLAIATQSVESELEDRQADADRVPIIIDPSGLGREQRPYFIECTGEYVELRRTTGEWRYRIPERDIAIDGHFKRFLRRVKLIRNGIVIFLVRPDGVAVFNRAVLVAQREGARSAKLPLPGEGKLDFSRFASREESADDGGDTPP